jgi:hypothetical protein
MDLKREKQAKHGGRQEQCRKQAGEFDQGYVAKEAAKWGQGPEQIIVRWRIVTKWVAERRGWTHIVHVHQPRHVGKIDVRGADRPKAEGQQRCRKQR